MGGDRRDRREPPRSFEEAEVERLERAEDRTERFSDRADRAASASNARYKAALGALDGIEPGQPILVGHHSERGHRRAIARSDSNMRKSIEERDKATHYGHRAEAAEKYEKRRYDPTAPGGGWRSSAPSCASRSGGATRR
ncbi:DUF3560 domain-containing protein [Streptomyces sp. INA 01156]